jgi:hypothetical protein
VVWLAQAPTPSLEAEVERIANLFALPLTTIPTGLGGLESALAALLEGIGGVAHTVNRSAPVAHTANPGPRLDVAEVRAEQQ